jgi:hypothetical protein
MERVAIVARLKEGSGPRAAELIAAGPPFDLAATGIASHSVYLSAGGWEARAGVAPAAEAMAGSAR